MNCLKIKPLLIRYLISLFIRRHSIQSTAWAVYPAGNRALQDCYKELKENVDFIKGHSFTKFDPNFPTLNELNRDHLNAIHAAFERSITALVEVPTGEHNKPFLQKNDLKEDEMHQLEKSLNSVNGLVHSLEHLVSRDEKSGSSWFSTFLGSDIHKNKKRTGINNLYIILYYIAH